MYVCLCQGVTDNQIRDAIYEGRCSHREVREATGVGTQCGKCACLAKQVVRETLNDSRVPSRYRRSGLRRSSLPEKYFLSLFQKNRAWRPVFLCLQFNDLAAERGKKTFVFIFFFPYISIT